MTFLLILIFVGYGVLVVLLIIGVGRAVSSDDLGALPPEPMPMVSIIVPVRNEEKHLPILLRDLQRQRYPNYQVIIVDDHSEDKTFAVAERLVQSDARFLVFRNTGTGKKKALAQGIAMAAGSILMTTDADCSVPPTWISGISRYFKDEFVKLVFGGVRMNGTSLFGKLQCMEFASLIGSGAATSALGLPTLCNGANLAFRKSAFLAVNGYQGNIDIPSGDDEFLMRKIVAHYPGSIKFAGDPGTVVTTLASDTLRQFIHQRIRWAGKWKHQPSIANRLLALFIFGFQMATALLPVFAAAGWIEPGTAAALWLIKAILEFFFLQRICRFLGVPWSTGAFLLLQLIYPLYVVMVGLLANFWSFEWKGRKLKSLTVSAP